MHQTRWPSKRAAELLHDAVADAAQGFPGAVDLAIKRAAARMAQDDDEREEAEQAYGTEWRMIFETVVLPGAATIAHRRETSRHPGSNPVPTSP